MAERKKPYVEEDDYAPQSVYGITKMKGEQTVLKLLINILFVRTAWFYGEGKNFAH